MTAWTAARMQRLFRPDGRRSPASADTELWIEIERDCTIYGEEVKFGRGKVIRDGMGQGQATSDFAADTVITNAVILDYWVIRRRPTSGSRAGASSRSAKPAIPTCSGREYRHRPRHGDHRGRRLIATAGGIDSHIHFICPQQVEDALMSGVTNDDRRRHRTCDRHEATTCTPGPGNRAHVPGARRAAHQLRSARQRQREACRKHCTSR